MKMRNILKGHTITDNKIENAREWILYERTGAFGKQTLKSFTNAYKRIFQRGSMFLSWM